MSDNDYILPDWESIDTPESRVPEVPFAYNNMPDQGDIYVDPENPESMGFSEPFSNVYAPNLYSGAIDAATFLVDIPTMGAGYALGTGAEVLGADELAKNLKNPVLLSDVVKGTFELPKIIEQEVGGDNKFFGGFDATPRAPQGASERFFKDVFYISGGGLSLPASLRKVFGNNKKPLTKLLEDASGRTSNSEFARKTLANAINNPNARGPNAASALVEAARQYSAKFTSGLGKAPVSTLSKEQAFATVAGVGFAAPELIADEDGKIMMDLGEQSGSFDAAPTLKVLSSIGLPITAAHTPSMLAKSKVVPLIKYVRDRTKVFAKSLIGGFTEKGRTDIASRIFNGLESEKGVLENILLPAIESGSFSSPGSSTPIKILDDGTVVPEFGGLRPDTLQALKILGVDATRLAALDNTLKGRNSGEIAQSRLGQENRRAETLDETFELLKSRLGSGDETESFKIIQKIKDNLDDQAIESVETSLQKARDVLESLEPVIGRAEASKVAVEMLDEARKNSQVVTRKLFDKELIGTDFVDTRSLGDWAIKIIQDVGQRNISITPEMGLFYKLAGMKRLQEAGILPSGKPIADSDLSGAKGDGDALITADEIPANGLYDVFGDAGTIYAAPVKIETVQNFRSEVGDKIRQAYKTGNAKVGRRLGLIVDYIDDEILAAKNFEGKVAPENIRNIKIGRDYVRTAKERFGPNSPIGKLLFKGDEIIDEGFLKKLLKSGPESGARVELFRDALNEPQQVVEGSNVTWQRNPEASLTIGDNPNVIEADLLLRFTEGLAGGKVTQRNVDRFLTQYGDAIDAVPGLKDKFNNLKAVQQAADVMTANVTLPSKGDVISAIKSGASLDDIANARKINLENLRDRQIANTASEYIGVDVNQAAKNYITTKPKNAVQRAEELAALLAKDESGFAEKGFRAALWRVLRDSSRRIGPDGEVLPGLDTKKLVDTIESNRPYLEKFYDKSSMEFLDELVKGGPIQRTGIESSFSGTPGDVMGPSFGTVETVGAAGRSAGQYFFGKMGINTLVATGMGKRISAYTFTKVGESKILKLVEDALRDPEKAAELIRRYKEIKVNDLEEFAPAKKIADEFSDDPTGAAKERLSKIVSFTGKNIKGYTKEAIERAVKFGLIPAQAEVRSKSLDEDYRSFPPYFDYEDNRIRSEIEEDYSEEDAVGDQSSLQPVAPPVRKMAANMPPSRSPVSGSSLSQVSPVAPRPMGQTSQETLSGLSQLGMPLFANQGGYIDRGSMNTSVPMEESGIFSITKKPKQIVG